MFKKLFCLSLFLFFSLISFSIERKFLLQIEDDLFLYKEKENSLYRLTYDKEPIDKAVWSPDGKYIAYGFARRDLTADFVIVDESGQEIDRKKIAPIEGDEYSNNDVRLILEIEWREDNAIITNANVGPHGGYIDIWEFNPSSKKIKHFKRISDYWEYGCDISQKKDFMACLTYSYSDIPEEGKEIEIVNGFKIKDLSKKDLPEDFEYDDRNPKRINIDFIKEPEYVKYLSDNEILLVPHNKGEFYIYNIKEDKWEKKKKLPEGVILKKEIPEMLKFKIKEKEYEINDSRKIFDLFVEK